MALGSMGAVSGKTLVIVIVSFIVVMAIVMPMIKPDPMSSIEVARQKQQIIYGNRDSVPTTELAKLSADSLDHYIEMLNYMIRIEDSMSYLGKALVVDSDQEYTLAEANAKLVITFLAQRKVGADAKARELAGQTNSPFVDSLYQLVHRPMPFFPDDSVLIRQRNLEFERYESILLNQ